MKTYLKSYLHDVLAWGFRILVLWFLFGTARQCFHIDLAITFDRSTILGIIIYAVVVPLLWLGIPTDRLPEERFKNTGAEDAQ